MQKSKELLSMPVISITEGQQIGFIKNLVLDSYKKQIIALVIEPKGFFKEQKYIPFDKITSIGNDAVTVDRSASAEKGTNLPYIIRLLKDNVQLKGTRIITENGSFLGHIDEYYISVTSGQLIGIEFTNKLFKSLVQGKTFLNISYINTIGKEVIICNNEAKDNIVKLQGNMQEKFINIKESTQQIWNSAKQKSSNLNISLNRNKTQDNKEKDNIDNTSENN
ncbi:MAG: PRC-barrel domain-containing protein [Clostridiales bacterium]|nr:PRC-barrel domain-containing protein [Clostridiales bacterium]MCF8021568.1 PRC-barrel domain-containing protein [Clostridiales bacterium]